MPPNLYFCQETKTKAERQYRYPRWYHYAQEQGLKFCGSHYASYEQALADLPIFNEAMQSYLLSGHRPPKGKRVWLNARRLSKDKGGRGNG